MPESEATMNPSSGRLPAILGGTPAFSEHLHVGRPNVGDRQQFLARVNDMLDRRWFTNDGPLVRQFEREIAARAGVQHCVATCNATVALEIAIQALGFAGEVILPSYTFIATAHALQRQEITPVFADMDPETYNISPVAIERLLTPRTSGIIGVHVFGRPCDTEALQEIADRRGIPLLFDAAHAIGCSHRGRPIGGFGACEVFSFHATKFLNAFEGGAIVTNDEELAAKLRLMRNFGFAGYDRVIYLGTNGKMTEVCAAMGLTSLEAMDDIVSTNRRNYDAYRNGLRDLPGVTVIDFAAGERHNYQYVVLEVDPAVASLDRDELVAVLHADNVLARKYFWPGCHRMEPYRTLQPNAGQLLADTERVSSRIIVLPTGQAVTVETAGVVCEVVRSALNQPAEIRRAVKHRSTPT
jgi:dTDP-4-amino-4,6-dideoxygalactose transaminase